MSAATLMSASRPTSCRSPNSTRRSGASTGSGRSSTADKSDAVAAAAPIGPRAIPGVQMSEIELVDCHHHEHEPAIPFDSQDDVAAGFDAVDEQP